MSKPEIMNHPTVIIVRGLPGSGKSYLAVKLQEALGQGKVVVLDPDTTNYESKEYKDHTNALTKEGVDPKLHAYRFLRAKAYSGIASNKIIIWNQPFTNLEIFHKMVANLRLQAAEHNTRIAILVVEVETDQVIARARVDKRKQQGGHGPTDNTFARFVNDYASFREHGYNTVTVDGEDDVTTSVSTVMSALNDLWQQKIV